jgi:hypothetical protein
MEIPVSLYQGKLIATIGTINWRRQLFLFVLVLRMYVAFDSLTLYALCTMLFIFKKIFFHSRRWQELPDSVQANQNKIINWLILWSCQGYCHCAANVNVRNN